MSEFSADYIAGYNAALRFYEKHDAARQERIREMTRALTNALAVFDCLDVYNRYGAVRDQMREASIEPRIPSRLNDEPARQAGSKRTAG